jgi:GTPase SAR1 family protein
MYNAMAPIYYRDASAAIIVYDITSTDSFDKVKKWIMELQHSSNDKRIITIVGNKLDLETMRKVKKINA